MRGPIPPSMIPRIQSSSSSFRYDRHSPFSIISRHINVWLYFLGGHHHHLLSNPSFPPLEDTPASSHRRSHWWHPPRPICLWTHTRLHRTYLPHRLDANSFHGCQHWINTLPVLGRIGGGFAPALVKLEDCFERRTGGHGSPLRLGLWHSIWIVSSIQGRARIDANQLWHIHAVHWCGHGHHSKRKLTTRPIQLNLTTVTGISRPLPYPHRAEAAPISGRSRRSLCGRWQ